MTDAESREAIAELLRKSCPIAEWYRVLGKDSRCRYLRSGGGCGGCTYSWLLVADEVLATMSVRRASYMRERGKNQELRTTQDKVREELVKVEEGVGACRRLLDGDTGDMLLNGDTDDVPLDEDEDTDGKSGASD